MVNKVKIFSVGKPHAKPLLTLIEDYERRLRGSCKIEWIYLRNDILLEQKLMKIDYYCLDSKGEEYCSELFAKKISEKVSWNFVIGGHLGLTSKVKDRAKGLITLSKLTFPHELVRVIITEQIYRAIEILRNSPYHK